MGLAVLQVADWLQDGGNPQPREVAMRSCDLVGFSNWAVDGEQDEPRSISWGRRVGGDRTPTVESRNGRVVKRLGDGAMVVFQEPRRSDGRAQERLDAVAELGCNGYKPQLRAGVHQRPTRIGGDYLGVT